MKTLEFSRNTINAITHALLNDSDYGISGEYAYFRHVTDADFYTFKNCFKKSMVNLRCYDDEAYRVTYHIKKECPQVIDPVPIIKDGRMLHFRPAVILPDICCTIEDQWVITHEICHLLSLGDYIDDPLKKVYKHCFGINQYLYDYSFNLIASDVNKRMNEIINDAIVWHFLELVSGQSIEPINEYIKQYCQTIKERKDLKRLIGFYFDHRIELIRQIFEI